ncbi:hypothetical protein, partial [Kineococcus sp. NPDC059986]|uniref:hypothetical protein n=1 Tax=Kineococcus sp. NPDC059986 TaxID=3155538 RepID=UPI00344BEC22
MTTAVQEQVRHPVRTVLPLDADGFTDVDLDAHLAGLRRAADQAHARELLALADLVAQLTAHPHPDQAGELQDRREQVMGRLRGHPFAAWTPLQAAIELVALHHSRGCGVPIESALTHVWAAHIAGTLERPVWDAVATGQVTARQARTILSQSRRLTACTATLDPTGQTVTEGPALLDGAALTATLDAFHATALGWAREGKVGSA